MLLGWAHLRTGDQPQHDGGQGDGDGSFSLMRTAKGWQAGGSGRLTLTSARAGNTTVGSAKASWALPLPGAAARMVASGADLCLAYPHGDTSRGTLDCLTRAMAAGIPSRVTELVDNDLWRTRDADQAHRLAEALRKAR